MMEQITLKNIRAQFVNLSHHSVTGALAGIFASKVIFPISVPLDVQQGAIVGLVSGAVIALVQKTHLFLLGLEENTINSCFDKWQSQGNGWSSFLTLSVLSIVATNRDVDPLLGRVGLDLSTGSILKLCVSIYYGECFLYLSRVLFKCHIQETEDESASYFLDRRTPANINEYTN